MIISFDLNEIELKNANDLPVFNLLDRFELTVTDKQGQYHTRIRDIKNNKLIYVHVFHLLNNSKLKIKNNMLNLFFIKVSGYISDAMNNLSDYKVLADILENISSKNLVWMSSLSIEIFRDVVLISYTENAELIVYLLDFHTNKTILEQKMFEMDKSMVKHFILKYHHDKLPQNLLLQLM